MDIHEFASRLNGREYGNELDAAEAKEAKGNGIVIVFGASDDLMEFRGAINDEFNCYDGGTAFLDADGLFCADCESEECKLLQRHLKTCRTVTAAWAKGDYAWTYETDIPHATFDILEDGEKYCRGIVFSV